MCTFLHSHLTPVALELVAALQECMRAAARDDTAKTQFNFSNSNISGVAFYQVRVQNKIQNKLRNKLQNKQNAVVCLL
jgi:hypothetical protein